MGVRVPSVSLLFSFYLLHYETVGPNYKKSDIFLHNYTYILYTNYIHVSQKHAQRSIHGFRIHNNFSIPP